MLVRGVGPGSQEEGVSDPNDTCPTCNRAFTEGDDELGLTCPWCDQEIHFACMERHMCPVRAKAARKALEAWKEACADGRA